MKILKQVAILFGLCWISLLIEKLLPITFPSSVIALVLLLILHNFYCLARFEMNAYLVRPQLLLQILHLYQYMQL